MYTNDQQLMFYCMFDKFWEVYICHLWSACWQEIGHLHRGNVAAAHSSKWHTKLVLWKICKVYAWTLNNCERAQDKLELNIWHAELQKKKSEIDSGSFNLSSSQVSCVNWCSVALCMLKIACIYIVETSVHMFMHTQAFLPSPLKCE